jgi:hypothetical protein
MAGWLSRRIAVRNTTTCKVRYNVPQNSRGFVVSVSAQRSRRKALVFAITAAAFDKHSLCWEKSGPEEMGLPFRATPGYWIGGIYTLRAQHKIRLQKEQPPKLAHSGAASSEISGGSSGHPD